eukprot:jgi/Mesen1/4993/ME000248S04280
MACLSRSCILSSGALHVRSSLKRICQPSLKTKVAPLQLHGSQSSISGLQLSLSKPLHLQRQYRSSVLKVEAGRRSFLAELENVREESNGAGPIEFASPLQIVMYPDPKLRAKNKRVNVFDENLEKLIDEMLDIMYKTDGVGLAAPQVGVNVQLMVYNPSGERGKGKEYVLINPKIAKYSKLTDMDMEGCLSFPLIEAPVERAVGVKVDAQDRKGRKFSLSIRDWQARIFQHEYDHLEGTLFHDRMTQDAIDEIRDRLQALEEQYEKLTGAPSPEKIGSRPL